MAELEQYVLSIPEVTYCLSDVGLISSNKAKLTVQLVGKRERSRSVWQITDATRSFAKNNLSQAAVRISESKSSVAGISTGGGEEHSSLLIYLLGSDMDSLIKASYQMQKNLTKVTGIKDIRSNYRVGVPEFKLTVDRDRMKFFNTSVQDV